MNEPRNRVELRPLTAEEGGGCWRASFPDMPGCISDGDTPEKAWIAANEQWGIQADLIIYS